MVDPLEAIPPADRARIARAVEGAQNSTKAKFVLVAVPASDRYSWVSAIWAAVAALAVNGVLALAMPQLSIGAGFIVNVVALIAFSLVFDWWPIRVRLAPGHFKRAALHSAAHRAYADHLISKDDEDNGVMLFVSLAERHLEIVAEREAHARAPAGTWDRIVAGATGTMRNRGVADGLVQAVDACGAELSRAFPR